MKRNSEFARLWKAAIHTRGKERRARAAKNRELVAFFAKIEEALPQAERTYKRCHIEGVRRDFWNRHIGPYIPHGVVRVTWNKFDVDVEVIQ
jgi:hypothetical protein